MAQNILNIDDLRTELARRHHAAACCCDAARLAHQVLAQELADLRRTVAKPEVLCLENLECGVPEGGRGWDFIYSSGLLASLPAVAAEQVVKAAVNRLNPGGRLIFANILFDAPLHLCRRCRAVARNYRTEPEMVALAAGLSTELVTGQTVFIDHARVNVFLELNKTTVAAGNCQARAALSLECVVRPAV